MGLGLRFCGQEVGRGGFYWMPSERSVLVQCKRHQRCLNISTIFSPHRRDLVSGINRTWQCGVQESDLGYPAYEEFYKTRLTK